MARAVLEARDLEVWRGDTPVLRGLSLQAGAGEVVVVVGGPGAGKSTLLRCLGLDFPPRAGTILLHGADITAVTPQRRRSLRSRAIELVHPPAPDGVPDHTVPAGRAGMLLRGPGPEAVPVAGMRQRVQIAKALTATHDVLMLDEPLAGVDGDARDRIIELLQRLRRETRVAVIVATRDVDVAGLLADRVAVLSGGRIVESGTVVQVLASPRHDHTRSLLEGRRSA